MSISSLHSSRIGNQLTKVRKIISQSSVSADRPLCPRIDAGIKIGTEINRGSLGSSREEIKRNQTLRLGRKTAGPPNMWTVAFLLGQNTEMIMRVSPVLHLVQLVRPDFTEFSSRRKFSAELKSFSHN